MTLGRQRTGSTGTGGTCSAAPFHLGAPWCGSPSQPACTVAFKSEDAVPMAHTRAPRVDLATGFDYEHGGYEKRNAAMRATRHFIPPFTTMCAPPSPLL